MFRVFSFLITMVFISSIFIVFACNQDRTETSYKKIEDMDDQKDDDKKPEQLKLSKDLKEVSGLAFSPDGRLFLHNDEEGKVYQVNYNNGDIVKEFSLGDKKVKEDFEGIAIVNNDFYLVNSKGDLFRFSEGENNSEVEYEEWNTDLKSKNDVEGLCYDPNTNSLLLACKGDPGNDLEDVKAVYAFSLESEEIDSEPRFLLDEKTLEDKFGIKKFSPSGIEYNSNDGNFYILSSNDKAIAIISSEGEIIDAYELKSGRHNQPEGITFGNDGSLFISDEGDDKKAELTIYK